MIAPLHEQNRLHEIEQMARDAVSQRAYPAYRALLALISFHLGQVPRARAKFDALAAKRFADIPHDNAFLACMAALAEVCAALGDRDRAKDLIRLLEPYKDLNAIFGPLGGYGSVARYLG